MINILEKCLTGNVKCRSNSECMSIYFLYKANMCIHMYVYILYIKHTYIHTYLCVCIIQQLATISDKAYLQILNLENLFLNFSKKKILITDMALLVPLATHTFRGETL